MIKFRKVNSKKLAAIMLTCFILVQTGCTTKTNEVEQNELTSNSYLEDSSKNKNINSQFDKDEYISNYFDKANKKIDQISNSETLKNVKIKSKKIFIKLIDFIYYDGKINGITFDELSDDVKTKIMDTTLKIDSKIEEKDPGYKETIKDKSGKTISYVKEKLENGKNKIEEKIKDKVGEEEYNNDVNEIKESSNNAKQKTKEIYNKGKQKTKTWYENWKNK